MIKKAAIVRTAGPVSEAVYQDVMALLVNQYPAVEWVSNTYLYTQQTPAQKAEQLITYALDPSIDFLWSIRGGEGSADLIPYLQEQATELKNMPSKYLMGLSDFTPILLYFQQSLHWKSIHGLGAAQLLNNRIDQNSIQAFSTWLNKPNHYPDIGIEPINALAQNTPSIKGQLRGGNLAMCNISIRDKWELDTHNAILFFEDWHEKGYVVHRTLKYFQRIGLFNHAKALILGDFLAGKFSEDDTENQKQQAYLTGITEHFAQQLNIPVYRTDAFGHGKSNLLLPMYNTVEVIANQHDNLATIKAL